MSTVSSCNPTGKRKPTSSTTDPKNGDWLRVFEVPVPLFGIREQRMITKDLLRRLRNDLPMPVTIAALGCDGPAAKRSGGYFRFLCPHCGDMLATVNPRNNLAHCFGCYKNLNNIDLLLALGYDFKTAVGVLQNLLNRYEARLPKNNTSVPT